MLILNCKNISKTDLYYCYSPNLYKFLRFVKNIEPLKIGTHYRKATVFSVFYKSDNFKNCLGEWTDNKKNGIYAINCKKQNDNNVENSGDLNEPKNS